MSYAGLGAFGQSGLDPLSCMAQGGVPTQGGACVLTAGKTADQIQCEVYGGSWDGTCHMPGEEPPPVATGGMQAAMIAVCRGMGGAYDETSGDCVVGPDVYARKDLERMVAGGPASEPPPTPPSESKIGWVVGAAVVGGVAWWLLRRK